MNETNSLEVLSPSAVESVSRAEIDISISTAIKYPHHAPNQLSKVKQDMMTCATLDQQTAENCFYTLPRGGKNITGPSVRMAEIAVSCYGNVRMGTRILSVDTSSDTPHVVVQAVGHDLEKNIYVSIEKRRRIVKKKSRDTIDEDDVNLAVNACSAIVFRDVTFKIVPMALIKPVFEACRKVAIGDQKTLVDRRAKCLATFAAMGIRQDKIIAKLEKRSIEDIGLDDLETLIGLYNAIKEGEVNIDEAFAVAPAPGSYQQPQHSPAPTGHQQAMEAAEVPQTASPAASNPPPEPPQGPAGVSTPTEAPKPRGRPPGSKNKTEKFTPKEAAEIRKGGTPVALSAVEYPAGKGPQHYDENGDPIPEAQEATPSTTEDTDEQGLAAMGLAPEPEPQKQPEPPAQPQEARTLPPMDFKPIPGESVDVTGKRALAYLAALMEDGQVTLGQLMGFCVANKLAKPEQKITDLATEKLFNLGKNWKILLPKIQTIKV